MTDHRDIHTIIRVEAECKKMVAACEVIVANDNVRKALLAYEEAIRVHTTAVKDYDKAYAEYSFICLR